MNKVSRYLLASSITVAIAIPAMAHHSAAAYDTQKEVKLTGTVVQYKFANPHIYITLQAKKTDGAVEMVEVEAGAASVLNGLGFTKNSVAAGDVVTVTGNPGRNHPDQFVLGKQLFKADGTYYPLNYASRSIYAATNQTADTIQGTWFSPRNEFDAFLGGTRNWVVTDKGKAAMSVVDPKATTQKDCIPIGSPALMFYPVANTITVQKDKVVMKIDWLDSERTIYLDGRKHPAASETSLQGHSVGNWEGDALVVDTTNFKQHAMGLSTALPSSPQKHLIERFKLSPDHKALIYSGTVEDPVYLVNPIKWSSQWQYRPTMPHSNEKCDLEVARKFLRD